ncbi:hypothetical protein ABII15_04355 [Streptomyces sp. HUAS MG91]|uniref:Uncharacterized protein n=1 Tax=Streptomyces tabacisoli TaxID=3156398 RepID=A0AAU8IL54_9ACTN
MDEVLGPVTVGSASHGLVGVLSGEGFVEVARRTPERPGTRLPLTGPGVTPDAERAPAPGR